MMGTTWGQISPWSTSGPLNEDLAATPFSLLS